MKYKVIPFIASIDPKAKSADAAAEQLQQLINHQATSGWHYVRLESVPIWVAPDAGCFGIFGGKPGYMISKQMIVFANETA